MSATPPIATKFGSAVTRCANSSHPARRMRFDLHVIRGERRELLAAWKELSGFTNALLGMFLAC
jgi:hypothetical protein